MILDDGICTVFRKTDISAPGEMPFPHFSPIGKSWYKQLAFETSPSRLSEGRAELKTDARVRILQNLAIRQNDIAVLADASDFSDIAPGTEIYRIIRAFHGRDDSGPALISDLSLEVYKP